MNNINNNPTPQEHNKNIKDFLDGAADLIFDNQEKMTNGEYVELNRMMAEITIVNNRGDSENARRVINSLKHRNSISRTNQDEANNRIQTLQDENRELKQRLKSIQTISYPQATQTQTQQH